MQDGHPRHEVSGATLHTEYALNNCYLHDYFTNWYFLKESTCTLPSHCSKKNSNPFWSRTYLRAESENRNGKMTHHAAPFSFIVMCPRWLKGWLLYFPGCVQIILVQPSALQMNTLSTSKIFIFPFYSSFHWDGESDCLSALSLQT